MTRTARAAPAIFHFSTRRTEQPQKPSSILPFSARFHRQRFDLSGLDDILCENIPVAEYFRIKNSLVVVYRARFGERDKITPMYLYIFPFTIFFFPILTSFGFFEIEALC